MNNLFLSSLMGVFLSFSCVSSIMCMEQTNSDSEDIDKPFVRQGQNSQQVNPIISNASNSNCASSSSSNNSSQSTSTKNVSSKIVGPRPKKNLTLFQKCKKNIPFLQKICDKIPYLRSETVPTKKIIFKSDELVGSYPERIVSTAETIKNINDNLRTRGTLSCDATVDNIFILYGPNGNGKTTLPQEIARNAGAIYKSILARSFANKYYGESEKLVRDFFDEALAEAEQYGTIVVVFIDEINGIASSKEYQEVMASRSATEVLWDKLEKLRNNPRIFIFGATNVQPEELHISVTSRISDYSIIKIDNPDLEDRKLIIKHHFEKTFGMSLRDEFLNEIAQKSAGLDRRKISIAVTTGLKAAMDGANEAIVTEDAILDSINLSVNTKKARISHAENSLSQKALDAVSGIANQVAVQVISHEINRAVYETFHAKYDEAKAEKIRQEERDYQAKEREKEKADRDSQEKRADKKAFNDLIVQYELASLTNKPAKDDDTTIQLTHNIVSSNCQIYRRDYPSYGLCSYDKMSRDFAITTNNGIKKIVYGKEYHRDKRPKNYTLEGVAIYNGTNYVKI